jgi:four helix bundle protein
MNDKIIKTTNNKVYDLEERTTIFAENIILLCKKASKATIATSILDQLVRSGTSIGANYQEANGASSKKDFRNKIYICKKEAKETMYWLRLLAKALDELKEDCKVLWREARELTLIFSKIAASSN